MTKNRLIKSLGKEKTETVPFWFMRQAGRYLPEYMKIRSGFSNFLEFCYTPDAACEVTLQPIQRFGMDAAIMFSDILVIPDALGQDVSFVKGEGPKLKSIDQIKDIDRLQASNLHEHLNPVYEAIGLIRNELAQDKALIGFSGSPWTLACYMIEGQGSKDFAKTRSFAYQEPEAFARLIQLLVQSVSSYCIRQIESGVQVIQLFDSWAGLVPACLFDEWVVRPTRAIAKAIKQTHPDIPVIGFARAAGANLLDYAEINELDALGLDQMVPLEWARKYLGHKVLQGNLDNLLLASDREKSVEQTKQILEKMSDSPFIFNLGHGIVPHTPIDHVNAVVQSIKEFHCHV